MGTPRQQSWSVCHFLLQGLFLTQGSNPCLVSPALAGGFFTAAPPGKAVCSETTLIYTFVLSKFWKEKKRYLNLGEERRF